MDIELINRNVVHEKFIFDLFTANKKTELLAKNWPESLLQKICSTQYYAFENSFKNQYPCAEDFIIKVDSDPAGRIVIYASQDSIRIINLSLTPEYQNKGIGKKILKDVLEEAQLQKKPVYLDVSNDNPAFLLYSKLGFKVINEDDLKYSMIYEPTYANMGSNPGGKDR